MSLIYATSSSHSWKQLPAKSLFSRGIDLQKVQHLSISPLGENGQATPACLQHWRRARRENIYDYFVQWAKPKTKAAKRKSADMAKKMPEDAPLTVLVIR